MNINFFLLLCVLTFIEVVSAVENCDITVDITNGDRSGTNIIIDNVTFTQNDYYANGTQIFGCVCKVLNCVQECCPSGQTLDISTNVLRCITSQSQAYYTNIKGPQLQHIIHVPDRQICSEEAFKISLSSTEFMLKDHGYLVWEKMEVDYTNYCISSDPDHVDEVIAVVCVVTDSPVDALLMCAGMIISMPFLMATFLAYALLPDRNVHQKALMFYVLTLCIAYILLVSINLGESPVSPFCEILGYSTLFFFLVSFFWMNVICFDIWYTFSGGRGFVGSKRSSERKRFLLYSIYAWGVPFILIAIVYCLQLILPAESEHNPGIGVSKCFIADGYPNLWYFYIEAAILVTANLIFFLRTALQIRRVKKETSLLKQNDSKRHAYEQDKQKFNLYLKLLLGMGVNWATEIISWAVNWQTKNQYQGVWFATDFINAVYGVFIFFIFVFKKKIWKLLQKRYYNFIGKPHLAHTVTSSNTRTSHYSTADTSLTDRTNGTRTEELGLRRVP